MRVPTLEDLQIAQEQQERDRRLMDYARQHLEAVRRAGNPQEIHQEALHLQVAEGTYKASCDRVMELQMALQGADFSGPGGGERECLSLAEVQRAERQGYFAQRERHVSLYHEGGT